MPPPPPPNPPAAPPTPTLLTPRLMPAPRFSPWARKMLEKRPPPERKPSSSPMYIMNHCGTAVRKTHSAVAGSQVSGVNYRLTSDWQLARGESSCTFHNLSKRSTTPPHRDRTLRGSRPMCQMRAQIQATTA